MGHGPSVTELAEQDSEFRKYLAQIRGEIEKSLAADTAALEDGVKKYYAQGGWKFSPLMQADKVDVQQISTWSLDNVVKILNGVKDAIFGDGAPPDGISIDKPAGFVNSLAQLQTLNLLALNRAFGLVQGILETFATETSYRGQSINKVELVAPGLTLFVSIRSDVWRSKGFFDNKYLGQYLYVMRAYFSVEQAGDISKFNDLLAYEELKAAWRVRMHALATKIADPNTPFSAMAELDEELGFYADKLSDIQAMIEELTKRDAAAQVATARNALAHRRAAIEVAGGPDE